VGLNLNTIHLRTATPTLLDIAVSGITGREAPQAESHTTELRDPPDPLA